MISLSAIYLGLSNLVELDLSNNFLTSIPVSALTSLNNIKFLNMGSNRIEVMYIYIKIKGTVSVILSDRFATVPSKRLSEL